ncbi:MAG: hypothetical protein KDF65_11745, partial [Anaerolineae bacterium]|nr:hypothetical protein [Anaerolineae bacterium]
PWSRLDWLSLLLFAGLVALFYWRILTPNLADRQSFPPGDFAHQFWAFATFEVRELSAGRLPLWNPYTFAGAPFWADVQSAVFYPFSLLTILLSAPWGFSLFALELEAIAHFWLAATFMYLFVRRITASRAAALIAALTFTFSGYLTGYPSQQLAVLEANVWLPLILFFLHRAYGGGNAAQAQSPPLPHSPTPYSSLIFAGTAWGLTLLAGHPQSALIVAYLSSAYLIFLHLTAAKALRPTEYATRTIPRLAYSVLRTIPSLLLFLLTGLALTAIQFIPAVEYTLLSVRAAGTYDNMAGGFPLLDLIQIVLPGQVSHYSPLYVGVVGLLLALWVIFSRPNRQVIFWAVVAAVTLLITFGGNTFFYSPLYLTTPGFSIFRGQERWAFATAFSLSVLAGYGFRQLTTHRASVNNYQLTNRRASVTNYQLLITNYQYPIPNTQGARRYQSLTSLTAYLLNLALLLLFLAFYGLNDSGWRPENPFFNLLSGATLLTILLFLAWLLWKFQPHLPGPLFTGLAALLICFDLFTVNWQTNLYPEQPEWHSRMPAAVAAIKQDAAQTPDEPFRVYNEFRLYDNYGVPFALEDLWGASPLRPARYDQFLAPPMPIERTWELLNVKYVITWRQELYLPSTIIYEEPAPDGMTYVHRLQTVGPRAWLVHQAQVAEDATILRTLAYPTFDRWHIVLLEA